VRTKDEIIEKIRRLCEVRTDRGATPAEAEAAAAHAERLLHEHQLSLFDVQANTIDEGIVEEGFGLGRGRMEPWQRDLAGCLCFAYECELLVLTKPMGRLYFVGFESDVKVARYFFDVLSAELYDQATAMGIERELRGSQLKDYRSAYIVGAAESIATRIVAERAEREEAEQKEVAGRARALVHLKHAKVQDYISKRYPRGRKLGERAPKICDGLLDGQEAGWVMQLRGGIEQKGGPKRLTDKT
jgi:hypothetical protein